MNQNHPSNQEEREMYTLKKEFNKDWANKISCYKRAGITFPVLQTTKLSKTIKEMSCLYSSSKSVPELSEFQFFQVSYLK